MSTQNFDANKFLRGKIKPKVGFPNDLSPEHSSLYGYYHRESNYYNIVPNDVRMEELGGTRPSLLGHFYPAKPQTVQEKDMIWGYWAAKELKIGNVVLQSFDYNKTFGELNIVSSHQDVACIDVLSNNIQAMSIGRSHIEVSSEQEIIFSFDVEVVDNESTPMGDAISMYKGQVSTITIDNRAAFFTSNGERCELEPYQLKIDIFSRNTGILESDIMLGKGALIIGCGSVGSLVAMELARAGVGRFFLVDSDIMGYHNICRHQCGIQDVGKYKTIALKERILQINPYAEVIISNKMIQEVSHSSFEAFCNEDTIVVGCADNREGDYYADKILAKQFKMPFISIGCWERAFAGEIFYCLPEGMPAYSDFMEALGNASGRVNANTHIYMGDVGSFEPGISVDINFVTTIAIKLILDLLNRNNNKYTQRLLGSLSQYTLVCNTNNPKIGGEMAEIFAYPLQVTTSIEIEYAQRT